MQIQKDSTKVSLKTDSPLNYVQDKGRSGMSQMVGNTVPLQTSPSTVKYGAGTPNGTVQMIGETKKLSTKPISGYGDAPVSERTIESKKGY